MRGNNVHKVVFLLGSNRGDQEKNLQEAGDLIEKQLGRIIKASSIYETEPWGFESEDQFLNQALLIHSAADPKGILNIIQYIEQDMGRERGLNFYTSRSIDIDIVFIDQLVINEPELSIPHPLMHLRKFVLVPLNEIIPAYTHPVKDMTIEQLLGHCEDDLEVKLWNKP